VVTGAGLVGGEGTELCADARLAEDGAALLDLRHGAAAAEQRRQVGGEPRVAHPAAKRATCGLMPGISVMTITAGPVPAACTTFVTASRVIER
jgi:hypothetical protein